jgi:hypothetical protein
MLRGMLGGVLGAVALPPLEAMLDDNGEALADGQQLPMRFVTFFWSGGCQHHAVIERQGMPTVNLPELWTPSQQGAAYQLTPQLAPLSAVKEYVSVVSGYRLGLHQFAHHSGMVSAFSGHPHTPITGAHYSEPLGPSIDQVVADVIGTTTLHKSIQLGVSKAGLGAEGSTLDCLSHRPPPVSGQSAIALPALRDPALVYALLFGGYSPPGDPRAPARLRAIDAVREDAKALRMRLGAADQHRLDAHVDGLRTLEQQIGALQPACTLPSPPTQANELENGYEPLAAVSDVMSELLVRAFACDLTRVASFMLSNGLDVTRFPGHTAELHSLEHADNMDLAEAEGKVAAAVTFAMERFGSLLGKLRDEAEGAGNLLDTCAILASTSLSNGFTHGVNDLPVLVAGRANGALVPPGIHYRSPSAPAFDHPPMDPAGESMSNVLLSVMQSAAPSIASVGSEDGYSATPCTAILT